MKRRHIQFISLTICLALCIAQPSAAAGTEDRYGERWPQAVFDELVGGLVRELPQDRRLEMAAAFISRDQPSWAAWVLSLGEKLPASAMLSYLRFRIHAAAMDMDKAAENAVRLREEIAKAKRPLDPSWEKRLAAVSAGLRDLGLIEVGRELIDRWTADFPHFIGLKIEQIHWSRFEPAMAGLPGKIDELAVKCTLIGSCVSLAGLQHGLGRSVSARRTLLQLWRRSSDLDDLLAIFETLVEIGDQSLAEQMLNEILSLSPTLEQLSEIASSFKPSHEKLENYLAAGDTGVGRENWQMIRLLWKLEKHAKAKNLLPDEDPEVTDPEIMMEEVKTLVLLAADPKAGALRQDYNKRLKALYLRFSSMALPPLERAQLLVLASASNSGSADKALDKMLSLTVKADSLLVRTIELRVLLSQNKKTQATKLLKKLLKSKPEDLRAIWESLAELKEDGLLRDGDALFSLWINNLNAVDVGKGSYFHVLSAISMLSKLKKGAQAQTLVKKASKGELSPARQLQLAGIAFDLKDGKLAQEILKKVKPEDYYQRLLNLELWFRADQHEKALALFHKLETEAEGTDPLGLALNLSRHYLSYRASLHSIYRRKRVSLDIFTQLILRSLRAHVDLKKSGANWPEVFTTLNRIRWDFRIDDPSASRQLRRELWKVDLDIDAATYDFFQLYQSFGPQPIHSWIATATSLAGNHNPDFLEVSLDSIDDKDLAEGDLQEMISRRIVVDRWNIPEYFSRLFKLWKTALDKKNDPESILEAGLLCSAMAAFKKDLLDGGSGNIGDAREDIKNLLEHLNQKKQALHSKDHVPGFIRSRVSFESLEGKRILSQETIREQFENESEFFSNCLIHSASAKDPYVLTLELITDRRGQVRRVYFRDLPSGMGDERQCMRKRLFGYTFRDIEPPLGYAKIALKVTPFPPKGLTTAEIDIVSMRLDRMKKRIAADMQKLEGEIDEGIKQAAWLMDEALAFNHAAYRGSYSSKIYTRAAWWFDRIAVDDKTAKRLLGQKTWVRLIPIFGIVAIPLILFMGWFAVLRRRRS